MELTELQKVRARLIGRRFGKLVVVTPVWALHGFAFICKCDCGNEIRLCESMLVKGSGRKSCGCLQSPKLLGKRFGRLVVTRSLRKRTDNGSRRWLCECDCGNTKVAKSSALISGGVRSCGCLHRESASKNRLLAHEKIRRPFGFSLWNACRYKSAEKRGLSFTIDLKAFNELTLSSCVYCGALPSPRNGIDRVDSKKGYDIENCVPCCYVCNWMKSDLSLEDFKVHIRKIFSKLFHEED